MLNDDIDFRLLLQTKQIRKHKKKDHFDRMASSVSSLLLANQKKMKELISLKYEVNRSPTTREYIIKQHVMKGERDTVCNISLNLSFN